MTSVSVIIPNCNYGRFLATCLESVLGQQEIEVRVIVIDNCSTDNSLDVVEGFATQDQRLEVRVHERNVGLIGSLNEGLDWAISSGSDLSMTLSADDVLTPGALSRASRVFAAAPTVGLVHGKVIRLPGDAGPVWCNKAYKGFVIEEGKAWIEKVCRSGRNPFFDPEVVVRTSLYAELGYYSPVLPHTSDMQMWLRCAARMDVGRVLGAEQAYYREHPQQLSQDFWNGRLGDLEGRRRAFAEFFREDGALLADARRLQELAAHALSIDAYRLASRAYDHGDTDHVSIDDLVRFARDSDPTTTTSWVARGLTVRRRLGPRWSRPLRLLEWSNIMAAMRARLSWRWRQLRSLRSRRS